MPFRFCQTNTVRPGTPSLRASRFIPDHGKACFTEMDKLAILFNGLNMSISPCYVSLRRNRGEPSFHYAVLKGRCPCATGSDLASLGFRCGHSPALGFGTFASAKDNAFLPGGGLLKDRLDADAHPNCKFRINRNLIAYRNYTVLLHTRK
ncbi:MAG: hypothetical protein A4E65_01205 [Syntrophorhabdus sp. PtaU1.Bin153]|nr:MAG: hypothetical protein A4E65_01205 [Syntrophorhabdus sp. PtaU1.Bin153]